ncbi:hypothetical protein Pfo_027492, partial [Paulownia fortunei]
PPPSSTTTHSPDFRLGMNLIVQYHLPRLNPSRWMPKIRAKLVATGCVYGWVWDGDAGVGGWGWFGGCGGEETKRKKKFEMGNYLFCIKTRSFSIFGCIDKGSLLAFLQLSCKNYDSVL